MSNGLGYVIQRIDHRPFSKRIDATKIDGVRLPTRPREAQSKGFRASGLADCLRRIGYRLLGVPASNDTYNPDWEMAADMGSAAHINFQKHLIAAGMLYEHPEFGPAVELPLAGCCDLRLADLRNKLGFTGHIDGVVQVNGGGLAIWDLKTVQSKYMDPDYQWLPDKLQHYAVQVNAYAHFFATPEGQKVAQAFVLMASRDDTSVRALYRVPYQPEHAEAELARLERAHTAVAAGELPAPEPQRGPCNLCEWMSLCLEQRREAQEQRVSDEEFGG